MDDLISRQAAIDQLHQSYNLLDAEQRLEELPTAEIIRCKDCKWWDDKGSGMGYCLAAKHGYWSAHWEISIYRTYKGDFFCADAERRTDG